MGKTIRTVLGAVEPETFGFCHSHEHIWIEDGQSARVNAALCIDDEEKCLAELKLFYRAGGRAIIDAQPGGCGRDIEKLRVLSRGSGVHIVASTGFHKLEFYPEDHRIFTMSEDELARLFAADLTQGSCGQIKAALDSGQCAPHIDKTYAKLFSAAAEAAGQTGAPLMVHIEQGSDPAALADWLSARGLGGLAGGNIIFCHMDRAVDDIGVHREICRRGIYAEYDTIGRPKYHGDGREAEIFCGMIEAGFEKLLLAGLDSTRARLKSFGGEPGLDHIINSFIPRLRSAGLSQDQIDLIFVRNPAAAFSF